MNISIDYDKQFTVYLHDVIQEDADNIINNLIWDEQRVKKNYKTAEFNLGEVRFILFSKTKEEGGEK